LRLLVGASLVYAAPKAAPRASEGSCRQAVNGLISLLDAKTDSNADAKTDNTPLYRDTYAVVVNTCGPPAPNAKPEPGALAPGGVPCHDLAAALVDLIDDGKMNTATFVKARGDFAVVCAPR
jgi:hypothetical protein